MAIMDGIWSDEAGRLAARIELRLEQHKIHVENLELGSRDRQRAEALVRRLEDRLSGLRRLRERATH